MTIKSGTVVGGSTGIYNTSTGAVTIGELGGRVSADDPNIKGGTYGINSTNANAQVYFYDGMFTGSTNNSINSSITAQEPNYDIITITNQDGSESKFLSNDVLVRNLDTLEDYSTLAEAISEASTGDTLQLLRDLVTTSSFTTLTIPSEISLTIDMNNHVINQNGTTGSFIENNGTLSFIDSYSSNNSSSSSIRNNTTNPTITNNGTLLISYFKGEARVSGARIIDNTSTGTLTAGNLTMVDQNSNTLLLNDGIATINSGTINSNSSSTSSILNNNSLTINDITYTGSINNAGTLYFNGGSNTENQTSTSLINSGTAYLSSNSHTLSINKVSNSGTLNMSSGNVTQILTTGDVYITGGKVAGSDTAIKVQTGGSLQLGTKDGTTDSTNPQIGNDNNKVNITGSDISFYDGKVRGSTLPIEGTIVDIETDHNIVLDGAYEYLTPNAIIKNENTDIDYTSIAQAVSAASNGDSLKVLENVVLYTSSQNVTIPSGKNVILNMNKNVFGSAGTAFTNNGTLTIVGSWELSSEGGTGNTIINNTGTLTLYDANASNDEYYFSGLKISGEIVNSGTLNIDKANVNDITNTGTIVMNDGLMSGYTKNTGSITINGGRISASKTAIENDYTNSTLVINDGIFYASADVAIDNKSGSLTINDGTFNVYKDKILVKNSSTVIFKGGSYSNRYAYTNSDYGGYIVWNVSGTSTISGLTDMSINLGKIEAGKLNINNTTLSNNLYGGINASGGTINISNSSFANGFQNRNTRFIDSTNTNININNTTIDVSTNSVPINTTDGNISITGNTEINFASVPITSTGTITIGTKDGNYNVSYPHITGGNMAVNSYGTMKFYDGILTGSTAYGAYYGSINDVETDYIVDTSTVDDTINAFLRLPGENEKVIIFNNINYSNLQDAIDVAPDNATSTMVLYTNYVLPQDIVVPSGKVINLYLNDHTIDNDGHTITGSLNQLNGAPTGASLSKFLSDTFSSKGKLITLIITVIILTTLGIIYFKKRKHN